MCLLGIVAAHKTLGLYKSIKSALNPLGDLAAGDGTLMENGDDEIDADAADEENKRGDVEDDPLRAAFKKKSPSREERQAE